MIPPDIQGGLVSKREPRVFETLPPLRGRIGWIIPEAYDVGREAKILLRESSLARDYYDRATGVFDFSSPETFLDGSKERDTTIGNLSYFVYKVAALEILSRSDHPKPNMLAGLGIGFLVALYRSRAVSFETGLGLISVGINLEDRRPFSERLRRAYAVGLRDEPQELGDGIFDPDTPIVSGRTGDLLTTAEQLRIELEALTRQKASASMIRKTMKERGVNSPVEISGRGFITKLSENRKYVAAGAAIIATTAGAVILAYRRARRPKPENGS